VGALPKQKVSKGRRNRRRSHHALGKTRLIPCPQCHRLQVPHRVCPYCGTYRGIKYIEGSEEE